MLWVLPEPTSKGIAAAPYEEGERFAKVMGADNARILVMVATAAVGSGLATSLSGNFGPGPRINLLSQPDPIAQRIQALKDAGVKGEAARTAGVDVIETQVWKSFNTGDSGCPNLRRVAVYGDGQLIGEWVRTAANAIVRTFP